MDPKSAVSERCLFILIPWAWWLIVRLCDVRLRPEQVERRGWLAIARFCNRCVRGSLNIRTIVTWEPNAFERMEFQRLVLERGSCVMIGMPPRWRALAHQAEHIIHTGGDLAELIHPNLGPLGQA